MRSDFRYVPFHHLERQIPAVTSVDTCVDGEEVEVGDDRDESC